MFFLGELRVLGNTVLDVPAVESVLTPYLGPDRTLKDVEAARTALEDAYHAKGFGTVFVDIPEQSIGDDGVVRLHVTESRLRLATITGTRYFSNRQIRLALPAGVPGAVPNLPALQAQIAAVNAVSADRNVVPVLKAGPLPGTVDLALKVQDTFPLHLSLEANDQYTADTSHLRASVGVSYDNAFGRQDSASLQFQTSPAHTSEVSVVAASYLARLSDAPGPVDKLMLSFVNSSSNVATLGGITVAGAGKTYGARYIHPVSQTPQVQSSFTLGAEYKDSAQDVNLAAGQSVGTPISYASLEAAFGGTLREGSRIWSLTTSATFGLPGLGSSREQFANKCYQCRPDFLVVRADASAHQRLPWGLSLGLEVAGQYAVDPVVSNEQFLIGGAHSIRGYLEAAELGDLGQRLTLELRETSLFAPSAVFRLEPYLFYDAGHVRFQKALPGQPGGASLKSLGFGLDAWAWKFLTLTLSIADPLLDSGRTRAGDPRVGFRLLTAW